MSGAYQKHQKQLLKVRCLNLIGGKRCHIGGELDLPLCAYDFHHIFSYEKNANVSRLINQNVPFSLLKKEVLKCVVLCKNCHAKYHYNPTLFPSVKKRREPKKRHLKGSMQLWLWDPG